MMHMRGFLLALLSGLAGCPFPAPEVPFGPADDAGPNTDVPSDICKQWFPVPQHFDPCEIKQQPVDALDLSSSGTYTLDTGTMTLSPPSGALIDLTLVTTSLNQPDNVDAKILSVESLTVGVNTTLRVIGPAPLIVASWTTISVNGLIDVGSHLTVTDPGGSSALTFAFSQGAGSEPSACGSAGGDRAGDDGDGGGGSGGGGGGGFQGKGGAGGRGDTSGTQDGGLGGAAAATPSIVRGGCTGAKSGAAGTNASLPSNPATRSEGGAGGGAIQLTARTELTVAGKISVGGAGGGPAQRGSACGGGGGGSGGYIGLESAVMTTITGTLAANGGGGGTTALFAGFGSKGEDGRADGNAAPGGLATDTCGRNAPAGSAGTTLDGASVPGSEISDCGGAGGGGAAGYILVHGTLTSNNATLSPPVTSVP